MSRKFKVTKSASIDLTPAVEGDDKVLLIMAYSYFTSRKRVPGGMSKEAKEAMRAQPRDSEYRVDGVIAKAKFLNELTASLDSEENGAKPWVWPSAPESDRELIYSTSTSTASQGAKWFRSRIAKALSDFGEFVKSEEVQKPGYKPNGKMRWPAKGYVILGEAKKGKKGGDVPVFALEDLPVKALPADKPVYFEFVTAKPLSGAQKA